MSPIAALVVALAQKTAPLEFELKSRGPQPAVEVSVNGEGPFLFALDTCASGVGRIDARLAQKLALEPAGQAQGGDGSGRSVAMNVVRVGELALGELRLEDLELPARNYNVAPGLPAIDGILGIEFFRGGVLTLDFVAHKLRFEPGAQLPEPDGKTVLALGEGEVPVLPLRVGTKEVPAYLDTGNLVGRFVLPSALAESLTHLEEPRAAGRARTVTGEIEIRAVKVAEPFALGALEFRDETITYPGPHPEASVGSRMLAGLSVALDMTHRRVRFERRGA